jgi:hypothetical protein
VLPMSLFDHLKEAITSKPSKLNNKPLFYKADSDAKNQLEQLKEFLKTAPSHIKNQVEQDIKMLAYGIAGEEKVAFELNNSFIPMIVLHDLHLEYEGLSSQIDYLIITNKVTFIIECKNLIGNIEVNNNGDFIRTYEYNGKYRKEGIYSPITQNTRHLELIKRIRVASKKNFLLKAVLEKTFYDTYKTAVVLANPKTIINMKYAKKEIKDQIIRCDQLIDFIKKTNSHSKDVTFSESDMFNFAEFFLNLHMPNRQDYTKKYLFKENETTKNEPASKPIPNPKVNSASDVNIEDTPLYKALKKYRYETSVAENVKPYFIFNNAQLESLISTMPKNVEDLQKVSGFGEVKCQKYGEDLLKIINKYC